MGKGWRRGRGVQTIHGGWGPKQVDDSEEMETESRKDGECPRKMGKEWGKGKVCPADLEREEEQCGGPKATSGRKGVEMGELTRVNPERDRRTGRNREEAEAETGRDAGNTNQGKNDVRRGERGPRGVEGEGGRTEKGEEGKDPGKSGEERVPETAIPKEREGKTKPKGKGGDEDHDLDQGSHRGEETEGRTKDQGGGQKEGEVDSSGCASDPGNPQVSQGMEGARGEGGNRIPSPTRRERPPKEEV
jgi:hypothetical protein